MSATGQATEAPSDAARDLVRGAFDLHVHISPDVVERRIDDIGLARRFAEVGLAGFVLKSHYNSTAERAAVVREAVPGVEVLGAIVLNRAVGGVNPVAVEIAAREGARKVWLPTVDSENERAHLAAAGPETKLPVWSKLEFELREKGIGAEPVPVLDAGGKVLPETRDVLGLAAEHGMVLSTGHISASDALTVVDAALEEGVENVVVTHPDYPGQAISIDDQVELARKGAMIERCFTTPYTGKCCVGAMDRGDACGRTRAHRRLQRPRPGEEPAGRGRPAIDGREAARGRVHRGRGADDGGRQHPAAGRGGGAMSRRVLAIGAHAADFVWRAGGALALAADGGGTASVIALSYGERGESGALWKEEGQTVENVKRIRHGEAEAAAKALGADFRCLDLGDYPLEVQGDALSALVDAIRELAPDVLLTHTDRDPFNPDHPVAHAAVDRARALAAGAGVASAFETISPPQLLLFEPHQPELCNFTPGVFLDITPVFERKVGGDGRDEDPRSTCRPTTPSAPSSAAITRAGHRATPRSARRRRSCASSRM